MERREELLRALRKYARKRELVFELDTTKGYGSLYRVQVGDRWTIVQFKLNQTRIRTILKQLGVNPNDI